MNYQDLLKKVSEFSIQFFLEHPLDHLYYHNLNHTLKILEAVNRINSHYDLDQQKHFIVCASVWFHDTGILVGGLEDHELKSAEIAGEFLSALGVDREDIGEIRGCILATKLPQTPVTLVEKIVCDADLFNFGTHEFIEINRQVRRELESLSNVRMTGQEWRAKSIALLEKHHYHTEYCKTLLDAIKNENLKKLKHKQEEKVLQTHPANLAISGSIKKTSDKILGSKKVTNHHLRGVETMFQNSSSNHQALSVMGDNKAFIMISVNSIIISVAIGLIIGVGKLALNPRLIAPTVLLLSVNILTIIYSVLATRPRVLGGTFTREDVHSKKVNLLFFGSFYKMPLKEFEYGMRQMMDDSEFLYGTLIKDIYWQGRVLGRKFKLLRISYDIFMYGTAISVLAYLVTALI